MKHILAPLLVLASAAPAFAQGGPPPPTMPEIVPLPGAAAEPDGKVTGLNSGAFAAITMLRQRNPRGFSEADAIALRSAVNADGKLDPAEADLLRELLNSRIRAISIYRGGGGPGDPSTLAFPVSGAAFRLLADVIDPPSDLAPLWAAGKPGWFALIAEARKGKRQGDRVVGFVMARVGEAWKLSNTANAYRPVRDLVGQLYTWSTEAQGFDNVRSGRAVLWRAAYGADIADQDRMPDFIYNWIKPSA